MIRTLETIFKESNIGVNKYEILTNKTIQPKTSYTSLNNVIFYCNIIQPHEPSSMELV